MPTDCFIGLMSGTSLDGVDASVVAFPAGRARLVASLSCPFDKPLKAQLRMLARDSQLSPQVLADADHTLAKRYAAAVQAVLKRAGMGAESITAIGCHGQTIRHLPAKGFSWQIGNPARLAASTGLPVVADFRRSDMARGGQGAPLAPVFHQAFFADSGERRMSVNIGGIANLSRLIPGEPPQGWDSGPGNTLMDAWYRKHHDDGDWDEQGQWAAAGASRDALLSALLADPYFQTPPPKSTGPEHFNLDWLSCTAKDPLKDHRPEDVQATLLELTCRPIAAAARAMGADGVILCGGGAYNRQLVDRLTSLLGHTRLRLSDDLGIPADQVESAGFAWLARERWQQRPLSLAAVTGAGDDGLAGAIWHP